jgi:hypothetical protein
MLSFVVPAVKHFICDVRESIAAHNEMKKEGYIDLGEPVNQIGGYNVYCSDKALIISGIPSSVPGAIVSSDDEGGYDVVVNTATMDQSSAFIYAAVMHEIGHIELHFGNPHPTINRCLKIFSDQSLEMEADDYVRDHDGAAALNHMLDVMNKYGYDVKKRIEHQSRIRI